MVIPNLKFSEMGGGGGLSGLQFQKGAFWKIWTKIYCSARNLLVHRSSLSHTTYVETNKFPRRLLFPKFIESMLPLSSLLKIILNKSIRFSDFREFFLTLKNGHQGINRS